MGRLISAHVLTIAIGLLSVGSTESAFAQRGPLRPAEHPLERAIKEHDFDEIPRFYQEQIERRQLDELRTAVNKDQPELLTVTRLLEEFDNSINLPAEKLRQLSSLLRDRTRKDELVQTASSTPYLLSRLPTNPAKRLVAQHLLTREVTPALDKQVDRDAVVLMPFPISLAAKNLLKAIPESRQAKNGLLGSVTSGEFKTLDANMFSSLHGKTLVVVGHVDEIRGALFFCNKGCSWRSPVPVHRQSRRGIETSWV
jgi:hypothetical protein